jgi:hypothetical protein
LLKSLAPRQILAPATQVQIQITDATIINRRIHGNAIANSPY